MTRGVAVITGASSGIGAATARQLAAAGFDVVLGARRTERVEQLAAELGGRAMHLDVTDTASVDAFCAQVPECRVLVNNAGGALGRDHVEHADEEEWRWMYDANVMGVMRMTRALLPAIEASGDGHIVMVGSIAGHEAYVGGGGYNAVKFALKALTKALRLELLGRPIRVTSVDPGMVETEFSVVRFHGDQAKADAVYAGMTPLTADDVADCITFAVTRPSHVNIDTMIVMPRDQAAAAAVSRRPD